MNMISQLRERRNRLWQDAKTFLAEHRDENGLVAPEYLEAYDKTTSYVKKLGEEIERLEEQVAIDRLIDRPPKTEALKPCPWCGSSAVLQKYDMGRPNGRGYPGNTEVYVECCNEKCRAQAPHGRFDDIYHPLSEAVKEAVMAWNTRNDETVRESVS